eukprot:SAG11_NODE_1876_length_4137_cov_1.429916_5_plen_179_part_00
MLGSDSDVDEITMVLLALGSFGFRAVFVYQARCVWRNFGEVGPPALPPNMVPFSARGKSPSAMLQGLAEKLEEHWSETKKHSARVRFETIEMSGPGLLQRTGSKLLNLPGNVKNGPATEVSRREQAALTTEAQQEEARDYTSDFARDVKHEAEAAAATKLEIAALRSQVRSLKTRYEE